MWLDQIHLLSSNVWITRSTYIFIHAGSAGNNINKCSTKTHWLNIDLVQCAWSDLTGRGGVTVFIMKMEVSYSNQNTIRLRYCKQTWCVATKIKSRQSIPPILNFYRIISAHYVIYKKSFKNSFCVDSIFSSAQSECNRKLVLWI